ncbi:peroxisomal membrane protein 2 [Acrasis kona]|uniref:Peroxisomal membrane protein 2 n=1 Tax=Acrasis kona TaxID=1008807 RepID=A0AAW2ZCQ0_9EUKA
MSTPPTRSELVEPNKKPTRTHNPLSAFFKWYFSLLRSKPIPTKMITSSILSALANVISQKGIQKAPKIDWHRVFQFSATAACISPLSHFWFNFLAELVEDCKPMLLSIQASVRPIPVIPLFKLFLDQLCWSPLINVVFFTLINFFNNTPDNIVPQLKRDLWPTLKRSWMVWPIASVINLNYVPQDLRVLFANGVSFFWSMYLSYMVAKSARLLLSAAPKAL